MENELLQQILTKLTSIECDIKEIKTEISDMKMETSDMKSKVDLIPSVKRAVSELADKEIQLEQIQASQQDILDTLAVRSIKQESELKRIK